MLALGEFYTVKKDILLLISIEIIANQSNNLVLISIFVYIKTV